MSRRACLAIYTPKYCAIQAALLTFAGVGSGNVHEVSAK